MIAIAPPKPAPTIIDYKCSECGRLRINVVSGSMCPMGHGRIYPKLNAKDHLRGATAVYAETAPRATKIKEHTWKIDGREGEFPEMKRRGNQFTPMQSGGLLCWDEATHSLVLIAVRDYAIEEAWAKIQAKQEAGK